MTGDRDRLADYSGYERATALFGEHPGEEDLNAWRERAPDEAHQSTTDDQ